jgi:NADH:ubiquinone oxidoreductase subunit 6 (subunit J)
MELSTLVFAVVAAVTVLSAAMVAFWRNIIYSAFSLLGTFAGVAGLYVFLGADFVAAVQILLYVGGILIIILFAVMLTHRIADVQITNRAVGRLPALVVSALLGLFLLHVLSETRWMTAPAPPLEPTTARIGQSFLEPYLLPFELASIVLLVALIGAATISRKETKG